MADGFSLSGDSHAKVTTGDSGGNVGVTFGAEYQGAPASIAVAGDASAKVLNALPWYGWLGIAVAVVVGLVVIFRGK